MRFGIVLVTVVFSGFQICHGIWPKRNRSPRPPKGENEIDYGACGGGGHIPSNVHTECILGNSEENNEIDGGSGCSPHSHHSHHHHHGHHHHHHHHHHRDHSPDSSQHNFLGDPENGFGHYGEGKCPCKKGKHKKTKEEKNKEKLEKKKKKLIKKTLKSGVRGDPHKFDNYCQ